MRTFLLLFLFLLCGQLCVAPILQACDRISPPGTCADGCRDERESDAPDQCGSCACCRANEPLTPEAPLVPATVLAVTVVVASGSLAPSPSPAGVFRPPRNT